MEIKGRKNTSQNKKQSPQNLSASEILSIFESVPGLYLILKPDTPRFTIVAVSDAYAQATITKREKILGKGLFEVFPDNPEDPQATGVANLTASLMKVLKQKKQHKMAIQKYDIPLPNDGFEVRYWSPLNAPVLDKKGNVTYIVHSVVDVTKTVRAEQKERAANEKADTQKNINTQLSQALQYFQSSFEQAAVGMAHVGLDGRYLKVNQKLCDIMGYTKDELLTQKFRNLTHPDDIPTSMKAAKLLASGKVSTYSFEKRYMKKDGDIVWVKLTISLFKGTDGIKKHFISVFEDITNRKKAEEALKESEERLALAQMAANIGTFEWNIQTDEVVWTPQVEALYGLPPGGFGGKFENWLKAVHPEDRKNVEVQLRKAAKKGTELLTEFRVVWPDGTVKWVAARGRLFYDAKGKPLRLLGINRNVSKRKAAEEKLKEAVVLRDDFISVASHELKTPVTSVKIFTQVLKKHSEQIGDKKAVSHLSTMDKQLNKLTELIYDLLNISKIQAGKMEFKEKVFIFDNAVKEVIYVLQQTSPKHKIQLQGKTNKKVRGDEERLGQVINNLISNAIKYSPHADKVVINLSSDEEKVTVAVRDFGIGMEKAHLERIFERFYRVYDTTDKTFPGLGIGLYISSEIIKRHSGKMWVRSNAGKGSTFYFSLPINGKSI